MKKKKTKRTVRKEEICEDWCFVCKDGGLLRVCDYKECLKAYHFFCVGKDNSFLEVENKWACGWHYCFVCNRLPKFYCHCCPKAVCGRCINNAEFVHVKGTKGFCDHCLKIALLVEENKEVDSDGGKVDFKDKETYECLFMEYWKIINEKEGLSLENLQSAYARLKMGRNFISDADEEQDSDGEQISDYDDMVDIEKHKLDLKRKKKSMGKPSPMKKKAKSKIHKKEFTAWGSTSLIQFLSSIGKDTSEKLSQRDVTSIIIGYINENNLFDPQKKKKVTCDVRLKSVLGRNTVNRNRIYDLLEAHFAENVDLSEEDELGYNSEDKDDDDVMVACKRRKKPSEDCVSRNKGEVFDILQSCFAAIVSENMKLVYLKRSLVQELLQKPETFESKVVGSFVRMKSDPNDLFQKNPYQLVQVKGIKKSSSGENNTEIFLQVSSIPKDICISVLSDDDFSQEECADLRQKVRRGLLKKFTVDELEQKARILHEDITKHWIPRELDLLQNLIDRANEKGWRRELYEYMERRQLLKTSAEQSRLLQKVPRVIPDVSELEPVSEDVKDNIQGEEDSPKSTLVGSSEIDCYDWEGYRTLREEKKHQDQVSVPKEKEHHNDTSAHKEPPQYYHIPSPRQVEHDVHFQKEPHQSISEMKQGCLPQKYNILPSGDQDSSYLADLKKNQTMHVEQGIVKNLELVELSSDDDNDDDGGNDKSTKQKLEDQESPIWNCLGPNGERKGPCSLSLLKCWSESSTFALKFRVWKTSQNEEDAVWLSDAVKLAFS